MHIADSLLLLRTQFICSQLNSWSTGGRRCQKRKKKAEGDVTELQLSLLTLKFIRPPCLVYHSLPVTASSAEPFMTHSIKFCCSLFAPLPHLSPLQRDIKYFFSTDCAFQVPSAALPAQPLFTRRPDSCFLVIAPPNSDGFWHRAKSWIMFVKIWPWNATVRDNCFICKPRGNDICLGMKLFWVSVVQGDGLAVFCLLKSAQWSAYVSKPFLRRINRWRWASHWSDSPLLLISLPQSQALGGLLYNVLVLCKCDIDSTAVKGEIQIKFVLGICSLHARIGNWFMDCTVCNLRFIMNALALYHLVQVCLFIRTAALIESL